MILQIMILEKCFIIFGNLEIYLWCRIVWKDHYICNKKSKNFTLSLALVLAGKIGIAKIANVPIIKRYKHTYNFTIYEIVTRSQQPCYNLVTL